MSKYRVDVYEDRMSASDETTLGIEFHFPDYTQASAFAEQMVVQHEKAVIISADTEK